MKQRESQRFSFVLPRFGEGLAGGAETLVGSLARKLSLRGDSVSILTTCARDNRTWENELPQGEAREYGLPVFRFPVDERDLESWVPKQIAVSEGVKLSVDEQLDWMAESVNSAGLYEHIFRSAKETDCFFFAPYLFGTTFWGSQIIPEKSFLFPCLHDEYYAYADIMYAMFRRVRGCLFNSAEEKNLAERLYGTLPGGEVGMGFEPHTPEHIQGLAPYFEEEFPYLLYIGRKETGKNVQLLIDFFLLWKESSNSRMKLVIAGGGDFADLHRPEALGRDDVLDIGHLSEVDKQRLIRHAFLLCQPSVNESFSIVLMEAWLLGTPVLVHSGCPVTRGHVQESNAGLYAGSSAEFQEVIERLEREEALRKNLGENGLAYVQAKYSWEAVLARFDTVLAESRNGNG